jgi:gmma-aminobutyric acid receptor subunit gamma
MPTIVPVPKRAKVTVLNYYCPVALTSVIMKCFERLVKDHITSNLPDTPDPLQFAYRPNRSTDDAITTALRTALFHLDKRNTYVRILLIDYSWVLDFLMGGPQVVKVGNNTSTSLILNIGAQQGCVSIPLLYSLFTLFTLDCVKNFWKQQREHTPIYIDGTAVEKVESFKFFGVHITDDLIWSTHTDSVVKKEQQHLFNLRRLKKFGLAPNTLTNIYRSTIESILLGCITAWYGNCTARNRRALQRVVWCGGLGVGELPALQNTYSTQCHRKVKNIIKNIKH